MENRTLIAQQQELLLKLRDAVNSQEEYDWVERELAKIEAIGSGGAP